MDIILRLTHHGGVRTTLAIQDDLLDEVRVYAEARGINLSRAASELLRRALHPSTRIRKLPNGLTILDAPPGAPAIPTERVQELIDEDSW